MNETSEFAINGDRRISEPAEDRLGFREAAASLAKAIGSHSTDDGVVIGLEGKWGSGKSSLLFLVEDEFKRLPNDTQPTVINFKPWLVGNRDGLLAYLFTELSKAIADVERLQGNATKATAIKAKEAGEALRKFAAGIGHSKLLFLSCRAATLLEAFDIGRNICPNDLRACPGLQCRPDSLRIIQHARLDVNDGGIAQR